MASNTQITRRKRQHKTAKSGKKNKRLLVKAGTPKFPIHPEKSAE